MCDFKAGDEIVCVNALPIQPIIEGSSYTVKGIGETYHPFFKGAVVVYLNEVENNDGGKCEDVGFLPSRFRKVERRNLTEWLSQSVGNTDKLDKKKVRVK